MCIGYVLPNGRYEELRTGQWTTQGSAQEQLDECLCVKKSMYKVEPGNCLECPANPYNLVCKVCKIFAHDGICKHVLAITHIIEAAKKEGDRNLEFSVNRSTRSLVEKKDTRKQSMSGGANTNARPAKALTVQDKLIPVRQMRNRGVHKKKGKGKPSSKGNSPGHRKGGKKRQAEALLPVASAKAKAQKRTKMSSSDEDTEEDEGEESDS